MQSTGSQSFTVYVYLRIAVPEIEQLFVDPPVLVPEVASTAPVELKVKLQIDEVPKKETDEKAENGVSSVKKENLDQGSENVE